MKKTKSIIMIIMGVVAFLTSSCSSNDYKIEGTTANIPDGKMITLSTWGLDFEELDSVAVKDGKFAFTRTYGDLEENAAFIITCNGDKEKRERTTITVYGEPGATIKVHLDLKDDRNNQVSGSPLNDKEQVFNKETTKWFDIILPLRDKSNDMSLTEEERKQAGREANEAYEKYAKIQEQYALENADNIIGITQMATQGALFSFDTRKKFMETVAEKYKNHPAIIAEKERMETETKTGEGQPMVDLKMNTPEGKPVKLSDFVKENKLTLVDFWASWCGPCRKELPDIMKIHATYKDKGLGLVGVSLDEDKDSWLKAITDLKLNSYPHMSELKKRGTSEASNAYNIIGIPFTLLISQDGTIIGRNLHDKDLTGRIEEYLNK